MNGPTFIGPDGVTHFVHSWRKRDSIGTLCGLLISFRAGDFPSSPEADCPGCTLITLLSYQNRS